MKAPAVLETTFASYKVLEVVGEGGSGRVYKATDESGTVFAIKLLRTDSSTRKTLKRFKNEYLFGLKNQHERIVRVVDSGLYKSGAVSAPFFVMPYYPSSLRQMLENRIPREKALPLFAQILDGVEAAHLQKIVHRDLKPENILSDGSGNLVIADFGIAHFEEEHLITSVETKPGERLANFMYAAPEQRQRGAVVDHRADIFALGLILNELHTREVPFGTSFRQIADVIPEHAWVDTVASAMMRRAPNERPDSIEQVKELLRTRSQEFETQQRLSEVTKTVVKSGDIDDPLILDPVRIVGVDWNAGTLEIKLSRAVNQEWIIALRNMGSYTSAWGAAPEDFSFRGTSAFVSISSDEAQSVVNYFRDWLPRATAKYEQVVKREKQVQLQKAEEKRRDQQKRLEERAKVLKSLTF
jgi:serine/threonine protein kinase